MQEFTSQSSPVVRTTHEFGFEKAQAVTFSGRVTPTGPREVFTINKPRRGFNCKDGSVSITNRSGNWGWGTQVSGYGYIKVYGFVPQTMVTADGTLSIWHHNS